MMALVYECVEPWAELGIGPQTAMMALVYECVEPWAELGIGPQTAILELGVEPVEPWAAVLLVLAHHRHLQRSARSE